MPEKSPRKSIYLCLILVLGVLGCPFLSTAQTLEYTNVDIHPITRFLNAQLAEGRFPSVSGGTNRFVLPVPGRKRPLLVQLTIPTVELRVPGIYARMRLQSLRIRRFSLQFDGKHQALRLRIFFHNQKNGIVGYARIGPTRRPLHFHVKRAVLSLYLKPRVRQGRLAFDPLEAELSFYEGNMPAFIRPALFRSIDEAITTATADLQRQLDAYLPELIAAFESQWPSPFLKRISVKEGRAVVQIAPSGLFE